MTARTAAEIYFNPDDIELLIGEEDNNRGFWSLIINRGPRSESNPFKVLITSEESRFSKEQILGFIKKELLSVKKFGDEIFTNPKHDLFKTLLCEGFETKEDYVKNYAPVLEDSDIERIMKQLSCAEGHDKHHSSTWEWSDWEQRYSLKKESKD